MSNARVFGEFPTVEQLYRRFKVFTILYISIWVIAHLVSVYIVTINGMHSGLGFMDPSITASVSAAIVVSSVALVAIARYVNYIRGFSLPDISDYEENIEHFSKKCDHSTVTLKSLYEYVFTSGAMLCIATVIVYIIQLAISWAWVRSPVITFVIIAVIAFPFMSVAIHKYNRKRKIRILKTYNELNGDS